MAALFSARRKPKRITRDDQESPEVDTEDTGPVVRRPATGPQRTQSKLRVSFNPGEEDIDGSDNGEAAVAGQKISHSKPSRIKPTSVLQSRLAQVSHDSESEDGNRQRPSYNKAYLDELRHSTPSTPKDLSLYNTPTNELDEPMLDIEAKFGKPSISSSNIIPSEAEIREKKERRARLAKEQLNNTNNSSKDNDDFIALEDYDSDGEFKPHRMQVGTYVHTGNEKEADTRLIHDDEDIAEGFDDFVEDTGRVTLSNRGLKEQTRRERDAIRQLINHAEGHSGPDSESDDSSATSSDAAERQHAYVTSQTHHGMDGLAVHKLHTRQINRPRQPKETTPIPKLSTGLTRLREKIQAIEYEKARIEKRTQEIKREKEELQKNQEHIQKSLEEDGKELERVQSQIMAQRQAKKNEVAANGDADSTSMRNANGYGQVHGSGTERGLESFGVNHSAMDQ